MRALALLVTLVLTPSLFAQNLSTLAVTGGGATNYIAKWSSSTNLTTSALCQSVTGGRVGIGTCSPTQRLQVNSGDVVVKGLNNFTSAGQVARYFVGDANHAVGAAYGAGLYFSTYKLPYAMVIQDQTGFVGIGTNRPSALLDIQYNGTGSGFNLINAGSYNDYGGFSVGLSGDISATGLTITGFNGSHGGTLTTPSATVTGDLQVGDGTWGYFGTGKIILKSPGAGITFPDGTTQLTACNATLTAQTQAALKDALARIARLEAKGKR